ncbi:sensor histidine kinase [Sphingomonas sp.]|uniref:sensor histidine kinase n=1 Tax=Sphingomonas sp. TaxID=28214 RepID=UPI002DD66EE3|nr:stimulus-sensing domain-containing protein [Sphingomonas sp.]
MADPDDPQSPRDLNLTWSARVSLTPRILAVNIIALAMLAGGFFYLDSFRSRILDSRIAQASREARLIADGLAVAEAHERPALVMGYARDTGARVRLYSRDGALLDDSRARGSRNAVLRDPDKDPWRQDVARFLDAAIDTIVGAARPPLFRERRNGLGWPDVRAALDPAIARASVWRAPDRTPVITAAASYGDGIVFTTANARDITQTVRLERFRLTVVLAIVALVSVLLSLFLARTIVRPLRRLSRAAVRVRLGRAREVVVPRLPDRRDEIGLLARALSDMSGALRARIDATEAFAADVTHELKNPLASVRSAIDGLGHVKDPELQERLLAIVRDDVHRLDRLITDISDASRLDAQLSRAKFEPIDMAAMIDGLVMQRRARGVERGILLSADAPRDLSAIVFGEGTRLERVFDNLIDNAISFSPDGGNIAIALRRAGDELEANVIDEGPGVPDAERDSIFRRFHSVRPEAEAFGRHSGLGLAIARTIVEGHGGTIMVESREDGLSGARFVVRLPLAESE